MKRQLIALPAWVVMAFLAAAACLGEPPRPTTRPSAVAGTWYPKDPAELGKLLRQYLDGAKPPSLPGEPTALVVPHAGYAYSGQTAALAYKTVEGRRFSRVVLLGPSHYAAFKGACVPTATHFATPLGNVPLDRALCDKLAKGEGFAADDRPHVREHSLEAQLPFLQATLKDFTIVPVLVGQADAPTIDKLAAAIRPTLDDKTLLVVSSDFTHYGPNFEYLPCSADAAPRTVPQIDSAAIDRILACDRRGFVDAVQSTKATICGQLPIAVALAILGEADGVGGVKLGYAASGDMTKDWTNSVSYAAIALCRGAAAPLTEQEQKALLRLARDQVRQFLQDGKRLTDVEGKYGLTPRLTKPGAAFVTLTRGGELRGCIGHIVAVMPLHESVMGNAMSSCRDPRFTGDPITAKEEPRLEVEISVLSPFRQVGSIEEIKIGRDGLILRRGRAGGVFLPQVPVDQKWNLDAYLTNLGYKAGLEGDGWRSPDARLYRFTAQVFSEKHLSATSVPTSAPASRAAASLPAAAGINP